jgi:hypothetical protein
MCGLGIGDREWDRDGVGMKKGVVCSTDGLRNESGHLTLLAE